MIRAEKLMVVSDITGKLAESTICQGIDLGNGERLGAIADIDCMALYSVDARQYVRTLNADNGLSMPLPKRGVMLWECLGIDTDGLAKRRRGRVARHNTQTERSVKDLGRIERITLYAKLAELGERITSDDMLADIEGSQATDDAYQTFVANNGINLD